jgi:hypothetical protein
MSGPRETMTVVFVGTQDGAKYCDTYTQFPSQFNCCARSRSSCLLETKRGRDEREEPKNPLQFGIVLSRRLFELRFNSRDGGCLESKYFKCSHQVFPVHHAESRESLSTLA